MHKMHKLARDTDSRLTVLSTDDSITITYTAESISSEKNYQFFIHADNDTSAGIQQPFAWDKLGAEYLVENGTLHKSKTSDTTWDWQIISSDLAYTITDTTISLTINKSLLDNLTAEIFIGVMERNSRWNVDSFYPESSTIASFNIGDGTNDNEVPELTLNGAEVMLINKSTVQQPIQFYDPEAIAHDNIDGDISNKITVTSDLDINKAGTYKITYNVIDLAGNSASKSRAVTVVDGISTDMPIDGSNIKWIPLRNMLEGHPSSSSPMKVTDTPTHLHFIIEQENMGENTQIFIDTDNDASTGMQFFGGDWGNAGVDYMIENRELFKSRNADFWSWDTNIAPITYLRKGNVIEFSIRKSDLHNLGDKINVGLVNRDANWNIIGDTFPKNSLAGYTLQATRVVQLPEEVRAALCDTPNQLQKTSLVSFKDGIEINGKRYFSELVNDVDGVTNDEYRLKAENLATGEIEEIESFYSHHPLLDSTSGAIYLTGWLTPAPSVRLSRPVYRLAENNQLIPITFHRKRTSLAGLAYVPITTGASHYGESVDFNTRGTHRGTKKLNLHSHEDSLKDGVITRVRYIGPVNSASIANTQVERLQTYYHNGDYYYAFTPGQLYDGAKYTHIGERIIKKSTIGIYNTDIGSVSYCK